MESRSPTIIKNPLIECELGGDHQDEILNMVCLKPECNHKLCCAVCIHQGHANHRTQSIKMVFKQARQNCEKYKQLDSETNMIGDAIDECVRSLRQMFQKQRQLIDTLIAKAQAATESTLKNLHQQLNYSNVRPEQLNQQIQNIKSRKDFQELMNNIKGYVFREQQPPSTGLLIKELRFWQNDLQKQFQKSTNKVIQTVKSVTNSLLQPPKLQAMVNKHPEKKEKQKDRKPQKPQTVGGNRQNGRPDDRNAKYIKIGDIQPGDENVYFIAKVIQISQRKASKNTTYLDCVLGDATGIVEGSFPSNVPISKGKVFAFKDMTAKVIQQHIQMLKSKWGRVEEVDSEVCEVNVKNNISSRSYVREK